MEVTKSTMRHSWNFIAESSGRIRCLDLARRIAASRCCVLITGPSGVGKDVLAEDIHRNSSRKDQRFVAINCAALSSGLFESELFGHSRGAYTGASAAKPGMVELAHRGTLFLDEVGELPLEAQAKLLRFLSRGTFWPVGGSEERTVDVRVIAATNRDLHAMLDRTFRADLFYRLAVIRIVIPLLLPADTRRLARVFAEELAEREAIRVGLGELDKIAGLASCATFPGGARALRNAIERYFLLRTPGASVEETFHAALDQDAERAEGLSSGECQGDSAAALRGIEDLFALYAARHAPNVRALAFSLGCSLPTAYARLKRLSVQPQAVGQRAALDEVIERRQRELLPHRGLVLDVLKDFFRL